MPKKTPPKPAPHAQPWPQPQPSPGPQAQPWRRPKHPSPGPNPAPAPKPKPKPKPKQVKEKTPPKSSFQGRAINYAYTDAKKIRKHLLATCDYASTRAEYPEFLVACRCFGYQGGVVSVWVYFALLDRSDKEALELAV